MNDKLIYILLISIVFAGNLLAQKTVRVSGTVHDTEQNPLIAATVVLLNIVDSNFVSYVLTNDKGAFRLEGKRDSSYLLQISYLGYAAHRQTITLQKDTILADLILQEATNTLESVEVIAEHIPVQMRGDTLSFNSAAFHVRTHDNVESLLQQLPGVEIDENGTVTVNGKKVTEILVDGKEFFGENAQIVLKSLPADVIKNIDITETKVDKDGEEVMDEKTINLKLKKDSKKGLMGSVEVGYGYSVDTSLTTGLNKHRYLGMGMLHFFSPKFQLTVSGATNNVNEALYIFRAGRDPSQLSASNAGITRVVMGGISMNITISKATQLNLTYNYFNSATQITRRSSLRSVLPQNIYSRKGATNNFSSPNKHVLSVSFKHKFDETQKLNFYCNVNYETNFSERMTSSRTFGEDLELENQILQNYDNGSRRFNLSPRLNYQKKFKKKGRELTTNVRGVFMINPRASNNYSLTDLYNNNGVLTTIDTINQEQYISNQMQSVNSNITFSEPVGKKNFLSFKLLFRLRKGQNNQSTYDVFQQNKVQNTKLSNAYWRHSDQEEFTIRFKRRTKLYRLMVGAGIKRSALEGLVISTGAEVKQAFYFPTGNFRFQYFLSKGNKLTFSYRTQFTEPRLEELQPIVNNQNPLAMVVGNPLLSPEYQHDLKLGTNLWNQVTFTSFYANIGLNIVQNSIIQSRTLDTNFRSIQKPINSELTYRIGLYLGCNATIKSLGLKMNFRLGGSMNRRPVILNEQLTKQLTQNYNANLTISNKKKKIVDFSIGAQVAIGNSFYENKSGLNVTYINHNYHANIRLTIAKKWNIETKFYYNVYANTSYGDEISIPIWSAGIYRTFFKDDVLKITIVGENLLNEAAKVSRSNQDGIISENQSFLLGRYVMLKVTYRIKRTKI